MKTLAPAEPVLEIVFDRRNIDPKLVPFSDLAEVIRAMQALSTFPSNSGDVRPKSKDRDRTENTLRLVKVRRGSAIYQLKASDPNKTIHQLRIYRDILANPESVGELDYVLNPTEHLSNIAAKHQCPLAVYFSEGQGSPRTLLFQIEHNTYESMTKQLFIRGRTSFPATVMRVGGKSKLRAALQVQFQHKLLFCDVENQNLARTIGQQLYAKVVVQGNATWLKHNWKLLFFEISHVTCWRKSESLKTSLMALREAGGAAWDDVPDVQDYLENGTGKD